MFTQERSIEASELVASTVPPLSFDNSVSIVGGGFSGTLSVIELIKQYAERAKLVGLTGNALPSLVIHWFDRDGAFARGLPYKEQALEEDNNVFILNQPAKQMSVFGAKPNDYVDWLSASGYSYSAVDFTPRAIYGRYLETRLSESVATIEREQLAIRLNKIVADVSGTFIGKGVQSSFALSARGHEVVSVAKAIDGQPGYVSNPYKVGNFRNALRNEEHASSAILVGGGATSIDAVRALEHVGFKGHYFLVTSSPGLPWRYDPGTYTPESFSSFTSRYLKLQNIPENPSYRFLGRLLLREIREARVNGFGEGHVYYGIDLTALEQSKPGAGTDEFVKKVTYLRGAIAVPESAELISNLYYEKRLTFVRGRADLEKSLHNGISFMVPVQNRKGESWYELGEIVVNCSPLSRDLRLGVKSQSNVTSFSVGAEKPLESRRGRTFGVESFRKEIKESAHLIIEKIFN